MPEDERKTHRVGMICAICSMTIWGVMPIYWKSLIPINSSVIILYRMSLTGVASFAAALKAYGIDGIMEPLRQKKTALKLFMTGLVIMLNWNIYIYAVNSGQIIETCIGYYIDPLVICLFGIIFFKERPTKYKFIAIMFACFGVLIILLHFMRVPLIALAIALTFATYTALKKHLRVQAAIALFYETVFVGLAAVIPIVWLEVNGKGALSAGEPYQFVILLFSGVLTATPLILFAVSANRISMISIGIIGYVAPSINLLIGVFLFKEAFDIVQFSAFAVIWVGIAFFTYGEIKSDPEKPLPQL